MLFDWPRDLCFVLKVRGASHSLLIWFTSCTASSKDFGCQGRCYGITQPFQYFGGVGLSFHAFNECRPPWNTDVCARRNVGQ